MGQEQTFKLRQALGAWAVTIDFPCVACAPMKSCGKTITLKEYAEETMRTKLKAVLIAAASAIAMTVTHVEAADTIKIGMVVPLTGPGAFSGQLQSQGRSEERRAGEE